MPKAYTEYEKEVIINNLKKEALLSLKEYGVKKTTVDDLVRKVHIPKGTFYLFYKSKEALLFDSIQTVHDQIQSKFIKNVKALKDSLNGEQLTSILMNVLNETEEAGLTRIMAHSDFDLILKKLPNEVVMDHIKKDHSTIGTFS